MNASRDKLCAGVPDDIEFIRIDFAQPLSSFEVRACDADAAGGEAGAP